MRGFAWPNRFTHHELMDFDGLSYPLLLHYPYFQLYGKQVTKQPDLVLALLLRGDRFTPEEKARDFAYYEPRSAIWSWPTTTSARPR